MKFNDTSIMPFGKHKGKQMVDVPEDWLLWFWHENLSYWTSNVGRLGGAQRSVMGYIESHIDEKKLKMK